MALIFTGQLDLSALYTLLLHVSYYVISCYFSCVLRGYSAAELIMRLSFFIFRYALPTIPKVVRLIILLKDPGLDEMHFMQDDKKIMLAYKLVLSVISLIFSNSKCRPILLYNRNFPFFAVR